MRAYAATDVGMKRSVNQDCIYSSLEPVGKLDNLFIVADGMGGHKAGDVASRYTVENFVELVKESKEKDIITLINNAIANVNEGLYEKACSGEDYAGMGTTLVVATISDNVLKVANVGDSRLYIVGDDICQVTRDHSYVEELVSSGKINRTEAREHEKKNVITRAIGGCESVEAEMFSVELRKGEKIVMCSDGLSNMVEDADIMKVVNETDDLSQVCEILIEMANSNGGKDNISVIIIEP
ncbi:MAG: Stp1/IreP family PP2C-type Ser/Thr phosphatase [Lachnospira sp.]|nr:Stp1/IreP family PP2C-type Ser/Thr phosphatase [Lachnospira sp.]